MNDERIYPGELALILVWFTWPVFVVAAAASYVWIRRTTAGRAAPRWRVVSLLSVATLVALPLTFALWMGLDSLPVQVTEPLRYAETMIGLAAYFGPPAMLASAITFETTGWLLRRPSRAVG